jgi:four helix bundle protein
MSRREEAVKQSFRDLLVWQKAMTLVTQVYGATRSFPREELYGLTSQIRRAAVSVPSNIAEGQARPTRGEFRQFLGHAKGSLAELETQLLIAENLGFFREPNNLSSQVAEVGRMLSGLMTSLALDRN